MIRQVITLTLSPGNEFGFIFPNELNSIYQGNIYYSLISNKRNDLDNLYYFNALSNEEIIQTELIKLKNNIFKVNVKEHGEFYFYATAVIGQYNKYHGKNIKWDQNWKIHVLTCLNFGFLELESRRSGFCFIGSSLNE